MTTHSATSLPGPGRLEAFSDGVLAIVITLLVLELKAPHLVAPDDAGEALAALAALGPKFLSYLLSFVFVAIFWVNHHRFFRLVQRVDNGLLWLNILLLLALSFVPFPTSIIGEYPGNAVGLALFALVLMTAGLAFNLMWRHARSHQLYHAGVSPAVVAQAAARGLVGPALYALAAVLAFVLPLAAWVLFGVIPLFYVLQRIGSAGK
ncbi:MAG: TMEM175 family protein [Caldilinea sp.]